jgi:hypothetical protein
VSDTTTYPSRRALRLARATEEADTGPIDLADNQEIEANAQHPATGPNPSLPSTHPIDVRNGLPEPIHAESLIQEEHSGDVTYDEIYPALDPIQDEDQVMGDEEHYEVIEGTPVRVTKRGPYSPDPHDDTNEIRQPTHEELLPIKSMTIPEQAEDWPKNPASRALPASELDREARKVGIRPLTIVRTNGTISTTTLATVSLFISAVLNVCLSIYGTFQLLIPSDNPTAQSAGFAFTVATAGIAVVETILAFSLMSAKEESER